MGESDRIDAGRTTSDTLAEQPAESSHRSNGYKRSIRIRQVLRIHNHEVAPVAPQGVVSDIHQRTTVVTPDVGRQCHIR